MKSSLGSIYKNQRVGVLVDVQNLYYSARQFYKAKINFNSIMKHALRRRSLIRAIAYVIRADKSDKGHDNALPGSERSFFEALEKIGFEVKAKDLQVFYGGTKKGDWDVGIAMDAIELSNKLDTIVLVSGDGDFIPLVEHLRRSSGCRIEVMAFGRSTSSKLKESADSFIDLDEEHERFLI
ncbi:MAG: NYN domain-containing protein [Candidatus Aenigmatarchaeota archaeon]